jgi:hypothetical protein
MCRGLVADDHVLHLVEMDEHLSRRLLPRRRQDLRKHAARRGGAIEPSRSRHPTFAAQPAEACGSRHPTYLGRTAVKPGRWVSRSQHSTARRRVRSRSVDPSGSTLRRRWVSWSVGPRCDGGGCLGPWSVGPRCDEGGCLGPLVRCDEGGCLGPLGPWVSWSGCLGPSWSAATKVGVLVRWTSPIARPSPSLDSGTAIRWT